MSYSLDPLLPLPAIVLLAALLLLVSALRVRMAPIGAGLRVLAGAALVVFLLGPQAVRQTTDRLADQALILLDDSGSMTLGGRSAIRDGAAERLEARLEEEGLDVVTARFGDREGTDLGQGLAEALAGTERSQLSGVFVLTDGRVDNADASSISALPAPMHALLIGTPEQDRDRRVSWVSTPRFGLVGEPMRLQFRIDDTEGTALLPLTLRIDGDVVLTRNVPTDETVTVEVPLDRPGERIIDLSIPAARDELSTRNNALTTRVNVIRDRLRVLLISGEPHAGERVWRNVLKSDPAVDLVHFTILKPADKVAAASEQELNLIPFPSRQLFLEKLQHFNVVIFDRYTYRGVISSFELAEVARYVERGGAVLIAAGPEIAREGSLAAQPNLSYVLPALPSGSAREEPFVPRLTEIGARHPITAPLEGAGEWGRWLRRMPAEVRSGQVLMHAGDGAPLLVTQRLGEGRIGMLLSDHLWLWARGFDGGGPHREFLRRLVHWLMAEPELEEEALNAELAEDGRLTINRRSLSESINPITLTGDGMTPRSIELEPRGGGVFSGAVEGITEDLVRLETTLADGRKLTAAAVRKRGQSAEFSALTVSSEPIRDAVAATGGGVFEVETPAAAALNLRQVRADRAQKWGRDWAGLTPRNARMILSEERDSACPRWIYALAAAFLLLAAWLSESGRLALQTRPRMQRERKTPAAG